MYAIGLLVSEVVHSEAGRRQFALNADLTDKLRDIKFARFTPLPTGNQRVDLLIAECARQDPRQRPHLAMLKARLSQIPNAAEWLTPAQKQTCADRIAAIDQNHAPARTR